MNYDYRIIKNENTFGIHEVYYNKKGDIEFWDEIPLIHLGDSKDLLLDDLDMFIKATKLPILDSNNIFYNIKNRINKESNIVV